MQLFRGISLSFQKRDFLSPKLHFAQFYHLAAIAAALRYSRFTLIVVCIAVVCLRSFVLYL